MANAEFQPFAARWLSLSGRLTKAASLRAKECPVCKENLVTLLTLPLCVLSCGHLLCRPCAAKIATPNSHPKTCPLCRAAILHLHPFFTVTETHLLSDLLICMLLLLSFVCFVKT